VATQEKWFVQFVVARKSGFHEKAGEGRVGVDIGWRKVPEGIRVAYWGGTDGDHKQVILPSDLIAHLEHSDELQSLRDDKFNVCRDTLVEWKKEYFAPDWFREATTTLSKWKSQAKLAALVLRWGKDRWDGDSQMYGIVEEWRKQDKHLYEWQDNERKRARLRRTAFYYGVVKKLSRKYGVCRLEDMDLRQMATKEDAAKKAQKQRAMAALSSLRMCFASRMRIEKVDPAYTSKTCHLCDYINDFGGDVVMHTCEGCGKTWDRDYNGSMNLLRAPLKRKKTGK
jgi:hypothetical protein